MLDKKDLDAIEKIFDRKFLEVEDRLGKKMDEKTDSKFIDFKEQFSLELSDVLHDIISTIDSKFNKLEESINQRFAVQDKKIDLLLEYSKDNLREHDSYNRDFSKINSKLLNHDLRLSSLEARSATAI